MLRTLLALPVLCMLLAAPAHACECNMQNADEQARTLLANPNISVIGVRVLNLGFEQAELEVQTVLHGQMTEGEITAIAPDHSCAIPLAPEQEKTVVIESDSNGNHIVLGICDTMAALRHIQINTPSPNPFTGADTDI